MKKNHFLSLFGQRRQAAPPLPPQMQFEVPSFSQWRSNRPPFLTNIFMPMAANATAMMMMVMSKRVQNMCDTNSFHSRYNKL